MLPRTAAQPASIAIHVLGLEVDVGDHRDLRVLGDLGQRVGVVLAQAGDPDDVATGSGELGDLLEVELTSLVSVVVIDCTLKGVAADPTLPTWIWRVWRRRAKHGGGTGRRHAQVDLGHVSRSGRVPAVPVGSPPAET